MTIKYIIASFLIFLITIASFGQAVENIITKVYFSQSYLVVPFPTIETGIADYQYFTINKLPPRKKMSREHRKCYNSWDTEPKYNLMDSADYDSIQNYILTSGILELDQSYTQPDTNGGLIRMKIGGGSSKYVIETKNKRIEFPMQGVYDYDLPEQLVILDSIFKRITKRYNDKSE
jgi:hypothetical protein